jgi:hypothetical protein
VQQEVTRTEPVGVEGTRPKLIPHTDVVLGQTHVGRAAGGPGRGLDLHNIGHVSCPVLAQRLHSQ